MENISTLQKHCEVVRGLKAYSNLRWRKNQTLKSVLRARLVSSSFVICSAVDFLEIPEKCKGLEPCWSADPSDPCLKCKQGDKVPLLLTQILYLRGVVRALLPVSPSF